MGPNSAHCGPTPCSGSCSCRKKNTFQSLGCSATPAQGNSWALHPASHYQQPQNLAREVKTHPRAQPSVCPSHLLTCRAIPFHLEARLPQNTSLLLFPHLLGQKTVCCGRRLREARNSQQIISHMNAWLLKNEVAAG